VPSYCHRQMDILSFMQQVYTLNGPEARKLRFMYSQSGMVGAARLHKAGTRVEVLRIHRKPGAVSFTGAAHGRLPQAGAAAFG
jgi:hypothetical protein